MPYDLIGKAGIPTGLLLILAFLIKMFMDDRKKDNENHQKLVDDVMQQCNEREKQNAERSEKRENMLIEQAREEKRLLVEQLDKYNDCLQENTASLKEISTSIKVIPQIQADVNYLKEKVK